MALELSLKELSLDLQNQNMVNTIVLPQGDSYSRKLIVSLYDNGQKYEIQTDASVDLVGSRADNAVINRHVDSYSGNIITLVLRDEELAVKGVAKYKINISVKREDGKKVILSSFPFKIKVAENVYNSDEVVANPRIDILEDTIEKAEQTLNKMTETDTLINKNEDVRKTNENDRIINENTRKKQEIDRVNAENSRSQAETTRISNENTRISNESNRKTAEVNRVNAENDRTNAEVSRDNAENIRDTNETTRKANEVTRENNEAARKTNETDRVNSETNRETAESDRVSAESIRTTNETDRVNAENSRVNAEKARVNAENQRSSDFATIKKQSETATAGAEKVNIEIEESTDIYKVKTTDRNGAEKTSPNLLNKISIGTVDTGEYDEDASATVTGNFGEQKLNLRLPTGKPFKIKKTYSSIELMNKTITSDLELYDFCMINTGSVEDEDTGKLYMLDTNGTAYITDLSGVQGIQGVKGETGETPNLTIGTVTTGAEGSQASATITGTKENPVINLTIPVGATGKMENVSASSIPYSSVSDTQTIKDVVDKKVDSTEDGVSEAINKLSEGTATPSDADYYVSQYAGGGTTTTSYHRRPISALWEYIKGKADSVYAKISHTHTKSEITNFPSSMPANGGNSTTVNGHTVNSDVPANAKFTDTVYTHPTTSGYKHIPSGGSSGQILRWSADGTAVWDEDNNTWRGIQNNLTSTSTTDSLSAAQGKILNEKFSKYATKEDLANAGGIHIGSTSPSNTGILWIDTGNDGIAKYHNGSAWVSIKATWG